MIYGYCRISTRKQNIERQIRNIQKAYPTADIRQEVFTGTKSEGRKVFEQLLKIVRVYQKLYDKSVELVFLKEPHINTETYKKALSNNIDMTGTKTDIILKAINEYLMELAKEQIIIAFEQSEKEVSDLHQRTKEGIETARRKGKQIGRRQGAEVTTKKSVKAKQDILKFSKDFGGTLTDVDCIRMIGIARNTYYRYKAQLKNGA